ncbi:hypothetical protein FKM82_029104 [Ascaphus truei]
MQAELKQMEQVKEEYEKKNQEQSRCIQDFLAEMSILRGEIAAAASLSTQESALRSQLKEETWRREKLEERCKELEQRAEELQERKESTERKLREASVESEQVSEERSVSAWRKLTPGFSPDLMSCNWSS